MFCFLDFGWTEVSEDELAIKRKRHPKIIVQNYYTVAIVPLGYPQHKSLTPPVLEEIKKTLIKNIGCIEVRDRVNPRFTGFRCMIGCIMITCLNSVTKIWLKEAIKSIVLDDGLRLQLRSPNIYGGHALIAMFIPTFQRDDELVS